MYNNINNLDEHQKYIIFLMFIQVNNNEISLSPPQKNALWYIHLICINSMSFYAHKMWLVLHIFAQPYNTNMHFVYCAHQCILCVCMSCTELVGSLMKNRALLCEGICDSSLSVPLPVSICVGKSWGHMTEYQRDTG